MKHSDLTLNSSEIRHLQFVARGQGIGALRVALALELGRIQIERDEQQRMDDFANIIRENSVTEISQEKAEQVAGRVDELIREFLPWVTPATTSPNSQD